MCAERRGATEGGSAAPGSGRGSAAESPGSAWMERRTSRLFAVPEVCANKFNRRKMPFLIYFFFLIDQAKIKGKEGKTFNSSEEYKQSCGLLYARSKPKQTRRVSAARADNARIPTHCHLCSPVSALLMFYLNYPKSHFKNRNQKFPWAALTLLYSWAVFTELALVMLRPRKVPCCSILTFSFTNKGRCTFRAIKENTSGSVCFPPRANYTRDPPKRERFVISF